MKPGAFALIPAFVGFALAASGANAQTKTIKEQLIGTWTLVSAQTVEPNGARSPLVNGTDVKGLQIFTDSGRVSFQVIGGHAKLASNDRKKMTADEMKSMAESTLSYFGTYTVNEADKSFSLQIESSTFQNQTSAPAKRIPVFSGDEMTVDNPGRLAGGSTITVWRRAK